MAGERREGEGKQKVKEEEFKNNNGQRHIKYLQTPSTWAS